MVHTMYGSIRRYVAWFSCTRVMIINGFIYKLILGYIQLAKCYEGLKNIDSAVNTMKLGLKFNPENGDLLSKLKKYENRNTK